MPATSFCQCAAISAARSCAKVHWRGAKTAFVDPVRKLSYGELADAVARVGPMLAKLGLQREDRLAMIMLDTVEFPILFWGAIRAGIIPIPLNTLLPVEQFRYILGDSRANALFISAPFLKIAESAAEGISTLQKLIVVGDASARHPDFAAKSSRELQDARGDALPQGRRRRPRIQR